MMSEYVAASSQMGDQIPGVDRVDMEEPESVVGVANGAAVAVAAAFSIVVVIVLVVALMAERRMSSKKRRMRNIVAGVGSSIEILRF